MERAKITQIRQKRVMGIEWGIDIHKEKWVVG
jgi:hypothetical protein